MGLKLWHRMCVGRLDVESDILDFTDEHLSQIHKGLDVRNVQVKWVLHIEWLRGALHV